MKISIVVPVYKVEKYIERCMQSLLEQTYENFEAIIVDDGSPDISIQLARNIVGDDPRFIFLEKENGGVSSARNYGLDHVSGDYIGFLDPDDFLSPEAFSKCIASLKSNIDIDILIFGYQDIDDNDHLGKKYLSDLSMYLQKKDILLLTGALSVNVWSRLYKREIFAEHIYFYTTRKGSIMNSYNAKSIDSYFYIYNEFQKFIEQNPVERSYMDLYQKSYIKYCFYESLIASIRSSPNYLEDCQKIERMIDPKIFTFSNIVRIHSIFSSKVILYVMFKISPRQTKKIYTLFKN